MRNNLFKLIVAASIIVFSCGEEQQFFTQFVRADDGNTQVRFVHAASDTVGVNLFLDDLKISGFAQSTLSTGAVNIGRVSFGGDFPVTGYSSVNGSSGNFSVVFPETYSVTDTFATKVMGTLNALMSPSSWYTVAFLGVSPAYQVVVYEDDLTTTPIDGNAYLRFANFIDNLADPVKLVATPPATADDPSPVPITLFQNVNYKDMTGFIALPRTGTYKTLQIVNETTSSVIYTLTPASSSLYAYTDNRVYTLFAKGRIGGTGGATPGIGRMLNR